MDRSEALAKLQRTELEILEAIDEFCSKYHISWFMDSGTVLGAARHQGFIPWDDDIDIGMLRADYDRFIELAETGFVEGFSLHTARNTPGFAGMFAKIYKDGTRFLTAETMEAGCEQGIFVDIFPYDQLAVDKRVRLKQIANAKRWQSLSYLYHAKSITVPHGGALGACERFACRLAHSIVRFCTNPQSIACHYTASILHETSNELSDVLISFPWPNVTGFPREMLVPTTKLIFEGKEFPAPGKWEAYLETMYGNWKTLPPEENRRTHLPLLLDFGNGMTYEAKELHA